MPSENFLKLFLFGLCMGMADLVPGISGGTVAFMLGFYPQLLESIKSFNQTTFKLLLKGEFYLFLQAISWRFLLALGLGICTAFISFSHLLHLILESPFYRMYLYAFFFGLILASFYLCMKQISDWNLKRIILLLLGFCFSYFLTNSSLLEINQKGPYAVHLPISIDSTTPLLNYDSLNGLLKYLTPEMVGLLFSEGRINRDTSIFSNEAVFLGQVKDFIHPNQGLLFYIWIAICGMSAVCALLLPGISGSYVLTLLGVYPLVIESLLDVIEAIKNFSINEGAFAILGSLALGVGMGAICFVRFLSWLLKKYGQATLAFLCGVMIGGLRTVWPFWTHGYALMPFKLDKGPQFVPIEPYFPSLWTSMMGSVLLCALAGLLFLLWIERRSIRSLV